MSNDPITPLHYKGDYVMRIIDAWSLSFGLGNVLKYVLRHQEKNGLEDLKKALWYLNREAEYLTWKNYLIKTCPTNSDFIEPNKVISRTGLN